MIWNIDGIIADILEDARETAEERGESVIEVLDDCLNDLLYSASLTVETRTSRGMCDIIMGQARLAIEAIIDLDHERPISTLWEAKVYVRALSVHGKLFHFEEDPSEIITGGGSDDPVFTSNEVPHIRARLNEMYSLPSWDEHECPIGYALEIEGLNQEAN